MQDSNEFLNKINTAKNIPANYLLVTMDIVKSLYMNINCIQSQKEFPQSKQPMKVIQKPMQPQR